MTALRAVIADRRGASVIELALVAPILATLLVGMVDISRGYSAKLELVQAAQRTIEKVMQGTVMPTSSMLTTEAMAAAGVPATAVTASVYLECNNVVQSPSVITCPSGQTYARYATVEIRKPFTPMFGTRFFPGADSNGAVTLKGNAGIRFQ